MSDAAGPTILLIRHGETLSNREGRVQGHRDSPLTPDGVEQARRAGHTIARLIGDATGWRVTSSPLGRCVRTAGIIAEIAGLDFRAITFDPRLAEIDTGTFSGLTKAELTERDPDLTRGRGLDHWAFKAPGGESHATLTARLSDWLASVGPEDKVVVISHGIAGRVLRGLYLGQDPDLAMQAESPQNALFRLSNGTIERISCAEPQP